MKPMFMMMVGLPYSGKSCYAEKLKEEYTVKLKEINKEAEGILSEARRKAQQKKPLKNPQKHP